MDGRLWGKSKGLDRPYPLAWHLADAAAVCLTLWDVVLSTGQRARIAAGLGVSESSARLIVAFWASLHDLGKAIPPFQQADRVAFDALMSRGSYTYRPAESWLGHDVASQRLLVNLLENTGYSTKPWRRSTAYRCAQVLGGHHGRYHRSTQVDCQMVLQRCPSLGDGEWQTQRRLLFEAMHVALGSPEPPPRISVETAVLATGLVVLADWLVSQESFLRSRQAQAESDVSAASVRRHLDKTLALAPALIAEAGVGHVGWQAAPFQDLFEVEPNPLQQSLLDEFTGRVQGPGLLVVTAATGHGKTEAALVSAQALAAVSGANGLYFALPTMATAKEMRGRIDRYLRRCATGPTMLTLLHSMAWLDDQSAVTVATSTDDVLSEAHDARRPDPGALPEQWLRGRKRPMLANFSVGTIDQAVIGMLPVQHNALRLLGLSAKVLIVDEAHAYDRYMRALLGRLMCWLGRLGCSVVLLSATLPSSVTREMMAAYASGAGRPAPDDMAVRYPGWSFVPADAALPPVTISPHSHERVAEHRQFDLAVDVRAVTDRDGDHSLGRQKVLQNVLTDVVADGGCAGIVCNTVDDAQATYQQLVDWLTQQRSPMEVHLLHARLPNRERARRTETLMSCYGRDGSRPAGLVVATAVMEMSLDVDLDLLVSDLAPIAQLLQRAGRCWRHPLTRALQAHGPRLVVLDPVDARGGFCKPARWGEVYPRYLLRATHQMLASRSGRAIRVPQDVEDLVESVLEAGPDAVAGLAGDPIAWQEYEDYIADGGALRGIAQMAIIPEPCMVGQLSALHERDDVTESRAVTRFGADSSLVLPVFVDSSGGRWLDRDCATPLIDRGSGKRGRLDEDQVKQVLRYCVPLPDRYLEGVTEQHRPPRAWRQSPWLRDVVLLPHETAAGQFLPPQVGRRTLRLDPELGLVVEG